MAFFKVARSKGKDHQKEKGIVYILKMWLGDMDNPELVYKIGVTTRKIDIRMLELAADHFRVYRYIPKMYAKRFTKTSCYYQMESDLHEMYKEYKYIPDKKIDGGTELFSGLDEDKLLDDYAKLIDKYKDKKTPKRKKKKLTVEEVEEMMKNSDSYVE